MVGPSQTPFDKKDSQGQLAESWEQVDPLTVVVKLKKGINWQDKAPVNGAELTAEDIAFSFNRQRTSPKSAKQILGLIADVVATDKYTVMFKMKVQDADQMQNITCGKYVTVYPKAVIDKFGNMDDWKNLVGSGPFIMTDATPGNAYTFTRKSQLLGL